MKVKYFTLLAVIFLGIFFRFYNYNWGNPFYFHPDERNIASSVMQLKFPSQMNPNFFAYGSFPVYFVYFTGIVYNYFSKYQDLFVQAILIGRLCSAILSSLLIFSIYFIGKNIAGKSVGILSALFSIFSVGFIQFAHFGTFEMWLTLFGLWLFYFSLKLVRKPNLNNIVLVGIILGIMMAIKISSLPLLTLPAISLILYISSKINIQKIRTLLLNAFLKMISLIAISFIAFAIFSPYVFLDFKSFYSSIQYESSVALGTLPVFYTGEFFNSIPIVFQFIKIYPFILNPVLTVLFVFSFIYVSIIGIKRRNYSYLMLIASYLVLFLPQAFLFAKWTRYMIPTLPFMYLAIAIAYENFFKKRANNIKTWVLIIIIGASAIFGISYFITAFVNLDSRIETSLWAKKNIYHESLTISETYDMGIVPFNLYFRNISLFNFYDLDSGSIDNSFQLQNLLSSNKNIILPSQRILKTRLLNQTKFPNGYNFYKNLLSGKLGYQKVYETPCNIFCKITYLNNPTFSFEETANVFDRPTVFIFKNNE
jgi:4-amino-4-deoxy-L-arabinose transferase-like glycosyltransferase